MHQFPGSYAEIPCNRQVLGVPYYFVNANPTSILADAAQGLLIGGPVAGPVFWSLVWAVGITVVFAPLALWALKRKL